MRGIFPLPELIAGMVCGFISPICSATSEFIWESLDNDRVGGTDTQIGESPLKNPLPEEGDSSSLNSGRSLASGSINSSVHSSLEMAEGRSSKASSNGERQVDRRVSRVAQKNRCGLANLSVSAQEQSEIEEWGQVLTERGCLNQLDHIQTEIKASKRRLSRFDASIQNLLREMGSVQTTIYNMREQKQCQQKLDPWLVWQKKAWQRCGKMEHALATEGARLARLQGEWERQNQYLNALLERDG